MSCEEFQKRLLAGEVSSAERNEHLDGCPECRKYAAVLSALETPAFPAHLDEKVLRACHAELAGSRFTVTQRRFGFIPALAAALAITLVAWAMLAKETTPQKTASIIPVADDIAFEAGMAFDDEMTDAIEMELDLIASGM